jgi:Reverse transcriptase (RNA-dependent DNA polymerase)
LPPITDEPQFISPTDVAIVPESEGATPDPAEDMAILLPDLAEPLPVMEEVVQLEQSAPEGDQPTQVQQPVPTFQMEQEAERGGPTRVPGEGFSFAAMFEHRQHDPEEMQVMSATGDPDTLYYHQAMREPDSGEFLRAVKEEFQGMLTNQVLLFIERARVPTGTVIFPLVWAMKRKRQVKTREVYKWKARLAFDGSRQVEGVHYDQTHVPVASWETIQLLLAMALQNGWKTRQLEYVLAFPQAPAERELYMQIPRGIKVESEVEYALKVKRNLYGQKQGRRVWNLHLV